MIVCRAAFKYQYRVFEADLYPSLTGWRAWLKPEIGIPVIPGFMGYGRTQDMALDDLLEILKNYYSAI